MPSDPRTAERVRALLEAHGVETRVHWSGLRLALEEWTLDGEPHAEWVMMPETVRKAREWLGY